MNSNNPSSIRTLVLSGLLSGKSTAQIGSELKALHPTSKAAEKVSKHVGWYRAWLKKHPEHAAKLQGTQATPEVAETVADKITVEELVDGVQL